MSQKFYTTRDISLNYPALSESHVRKLIRRGILPAVDIGAGGKRPSYLIRAEDLEEFLTPRQKKD